MEEPGIFLTSQEDLLLDTVSCSGLTFCIDFCAVQSYTSQEGSLEYQHGTFQRFPSLTKLMVILSLTLSPLRFQIPNNLASRKNIPRTTIIWWIG